MTEDPATKNKKSKSDPTLVFPVFTVSRASGDLPEAFISGNTRIHPIHKKMFLSIKRQLKNDLIKGFKLNNENQNMSMKFDINI